MKELFLSLFFPLLLYCQITTTNITPVINTPRVQYDSTKNFLGEEVHGYLDQELYLPHQNERLREYGWHNFDDDYPTSSIHGGYNYDELADKYFIVTKIDKAEYSFGDYIFTLKERKNGSIYYFQYQPSFKHSFPFIAVGYYNKMKENYVGRDYLLVKKGEASLWHSIDLSLDPVYFSLKLILENAQNDKELFLFEFINSPNMILLKNKADSLKVEYGDELWATALKGIARIGMAKELCEIAWGKPIKINQTIITGKKSEQWVYLNDQYLYFENGVLVGIQ